jgi:hypothetical protein
MDQNPDLLTFRVLQCLLRTCPISLCTFPSGFLFSCCMLELFSIPVIQWPSSLPPPWLVHTIPSIWKILYPSLPWPNLYPFFKTQGSSISLFCPLPWSLCHPHEHTWHTGTALGWSSYCLPFGCSCCFHIVNS